MRAEPSTPARSGGTTPSYISPARDRIFDFRREKLRELFGGV
jgi:hypothetical protein